VRLVRRDERVFVTDLRIVTMLAGAALMCMGAASPSPAPRATPKVDADLALACLQQHQPVSDGNAAAVSLVKGATGWGACIVALKDGTTYETVWTRQAKEWTLVTTVPLGATGAQIAAKARGISVADAAALAHAVHKPKPAS
jgi:hypothetical protein